MKIQLMTSKRGTVLMLAFGLLLTLTKASGKLKKGDIMYLTGDGVNRYPYDAFKEDPEVKVYRDKSGAGVERIVLVNHKAGISGTISCRDCHGTRNAEECKRCKDTGSEFNRYPIARKYLQHLKDLPDTVYLTRPAIKRIQNIKAGECVKVVGGEKDGKVPVMQGKKKFQVRKEDLQTYTEFLREVAKIIEGEITSYGGVLEPIMITSQTFIKDMKDARQSTLLGAVLSEARSSNLTGYIKALERIRKQVFEKAEPYLKGEIKKLVGGQKSDAENQLQGIQRAMKAYGLPVDTSRRRLMDRLHTSEKNGRAC